jgi:hypothetical protein
MPSHLIVNTLSVSVVFIADLAKETGILPAIAAGAAMAQLQVNISFLSGP